MIAKLINPYCTLQDVQRECMNRSPDDRDDMVFAINDASRKIEEHTRRDFLWHDYSDPNNPLLVENNWCALNSIYLPWPIVTLTLIQAADIVDDLAPLDPSLYSWRNSERGLGIVERYGRWIPGDLHANTRLMSPRIYAPSWVIQISGTFGYPALTQPPPNYQLTDQSDGGAAFDATQWPNQGIPTMIRRACTVLAAVWSGKLRREIMDYGSGMTRQVTQKNVPDAVTEMLNAYRRNTI